MKPWTDFGENYHMPDPHFWIFDDPSLHWLNCIYNVYVCITCWWGAESNENTCDKLAKYDFDIDKCTLFYCPTKISLHLLRDKKHFSHYQHSQFNCRTWSEKQSLCLREYFCLKISKLFKCWSLVNYNQEQKSLNNQKLFRPNNQNRFFLKNTLVQ